MGGGWGTPRQDFLSTSRGFNLGERIGNRDHDLLSRVLSKKPHGWALEFGVGAGTSLRLIAERMPVMGFDSFKGLPEDWRPEYPAGRFAIPKPPEVEGATIVVGEFADTLPFVDWPEEVGLIHFDADLYSSTRTALTAVADLIKPGTFLVFDEFHGYEGSEDHEEKAFAEFLEDHPLNYRVIGHQREAWACLILEPGDKAGEEA